jgi:hypothetical protein
VGLVQGKKVRKFRRKMLRKCFLGGKKKIKKNKDHDFAGKSTPTTRFRLGDW